MLRFIGFTVKKGVDIFVEQNAGMMKVTSDRKLLKSCVQKVNQNKKILILSNIIRCDKPEPRTLSEGKF